jgi:hypothetical protein
LSEQLTLIKHKVLREAKQVMSFIDRYKNQLEEIKVAGIYIDDKYLWKRFCKSYKVPKKPYKWTGQEIYDMNALTDEDLYRAIVKASGSLLQEMI